MLACLLLFGSHFSLGQEVETAVLFESSILSTNRYYVDANSSKSRSRLEVYPLSGYLSVRIELSQQTKLEIRPGFFLGGEFFGGAELGAFVRYNPYGKDVYGITGFNVHYNPFGGGHGTTQIEVVPNYPIVHLGISLGIRLSEGTSFNISASRPLSTDYGSTTVTDYVNNTSVIYPRYLYLIIRCGLDFKL